MDHWTVISINTYANEKRLSYFKKIDLLPSDELGDERYFKYLTRSKVKIFTNVPHENSAIIINHNPSESTKEEGSGTASPCPLWFCPLILDTNFRSK